MLPLDYCTVDLKSVRARRMVCGHDSPLINGTLV